MKKIILASATVALALGGFSCSETYDVYPESMSKVFMIKDAGTQNVVIYSAQDEAKGSVTVLKGGVAPDQAGKATLRALSDAEYNELAETSGVAYGLLPSNCYSIEGGDLAFNGGEGYKKVGYSLDVKNIKDYLDNLPAGSLTPAIYMTLESLDGTVNEDNNSIIIVPDYRELTIGFTDGNGALTSSKNGDVVTYTGTLSTPIDNQWDFTANVSVASSMPEDFANEMFSQFTMMPADAYEIVKQPTFIAGTNTAEFQININLAKMSHVIDAVPLTITSTTLDGVVGNSENIALSPTDYIKEIALTEDMLSTNAQEPSEGPIANVLDGNVNSFFHTAWSVGVDGDHYIEVTLPEKYSLIAWVWTNRNTGSNNTPAWFDFYAGTSDDNLEIVKHVEWDDENPEHFLQWGAAQMNVMAPEKLDSPCNVFRLTNNQSGGGNKFFCMSTLKLYTL